MHDLKVWVGVEADGSNASTTAGKTSGELDEMSRVAKVIPLLSSEECFYRSWFTLGDFTF